MNRRDELVDAVTAKQSLPWIRYLRHYGIGLDGDADAKGSGLELQRIMMDLRLPAMQESLGLEL